MVVVAVSFGGWCWLAGVQHCERQHDLAELEQRRENEQVLARNKEKQNELQTKLDKSLRKLRGIKDACLSVGHDPGIARLLNLRVETYGD